MASGSGPGTGPRAGNKRATSTRLYHVEVAPAAERQIKKLRKSLPKRTLQAILSAIGSLSSNPRPPGAEKLADKENLYRIRVAGKFRIVYRIRDKQVTVYVLKVADRKDIYRRIFNLVL